jgi:hypothetical protein
VSAYRSSFRAPISQPPVSQPLASQPKVSSFAGEWEDSPNFAVAAERALSELRDGITVTEWMAHHPGATKIDGASIGIGGECVILRETATLADGAQVARMVSFNPPRAPSPAVLPNLQGQSLINDTCTMSMVQIEVKVSDEAAGRSVQRTVKQQLDSTYGPSEDQVGVWHSGPIEIINAYDSQHRLAFDTGKPKFGPAAYVWAYLPFWKQPLFPDSQSIDDPEGESAQFHRAVALAVVDSSISGRMEKLYDLDVTVSDLQEKRFTEICGQSCTDADLEKFTDPAGDEWSKPLVPVLRDWLSALKSLGPEKQAAGLLAADRLLTVFEGIREGGLKARDGHFGQDGSVSPAEAELRAELESLGAVIGENEPGDTHYYYTGNWLNQAKDLAPDTEGGRLALLAWMRAAHCQPPETFISVGEKLIAKGVDARTAAQLHFMVGDAFSDIIVTERASGDHGKAGVARSKALQHYGAGLAYDGKSRQAKDAWLQAWHISAGFLPHTRYDGCQEGD